MTEALRERPALGRAAAAVGPRCDCRVRERAGLTITQIIARCGQAKAVTDELGMELPEQPNSVAVLGPALVYCLRPGDWLLVVEDADGRQGRAAQALRERLNGLALVADQSHGRVVLDVAGQAARELLQRGLNIDLHASVFGPGRFTQAGIAGIAVAVHGVDPERFTLMVARSFAQSLVDWLVEGGARFELLDS